MFRAANAYAYNTHIAGLANFLQGAGGYVGAKVAHKVGYNGNFDFWDVVQPFAYRFDNSLRFQTVDSGSSRGAKGLGVTDVLLGKIAGDGLAEEGEVLVLAYELPFPYPKLYEVSKVTKPKFLLKSRRIRHRRIAPVLLDKLPQCLMWYRTFQVEMQFNLGDSLKPVVQVLAYLFIRR